MPTHTAKSLFDLNIQSSRRTCSIYTMAFRSLAPNWKSHGCFALLSSFQCPPLMLIFTTR